MEQLAKAGRQRPTFWLEIALAIGAIGWGIYTLTWFQPILPVRGMPNGQRFSVESFWAVAAILIGVGQYTTYWYGPSRIVTVFGAGLWAGVATVFTMTNPHGLATYSYGYVSAVHLTLFLYMSRTWVVNAWAAALETFDAIAAAERDEHGR